MNIQIPNKLEDSTQILPFSPLEVAKEIDCNPNARKVPGYDLINYCPYTLKELSKKGLLLTYIFNVCLRLEYVSASWKKSQIIMMFKLGKPAETVSSYIPISLLLIMSKLFEKLILKRLKPLIEERKLIPDLQF